jgi:alcohol oxidase
MPIYWGEVASKHPQFSPKSNAAFIELKEPLPEDTPKIVYSAEDKAILESWLI